MVSHLPGKLVFVGLSPELTVDSGQLTVMESLRDNFKYSVQKYCDFSEYLGIIIITFISNYPRRGYHNCPLSTVNCPLQPCDKHQFVGLLIETDRHPERLHNPPRSTVNYTAAGSSAGET